jgi:hypothetical protein
MAEFRVGVLCSKGCSLYQPGSRAIIIARLSENAHLPLGRLAALSKVTGLRYPHPSSLRRTSMYASFLGISEALHMDIFHQPLRNRFFGSLNALLGSRCGNLGVPPL